MPALRVFYCAITCFSVRLQCVGGRCVTPLAWFVSIGKGALFCVQFFIQLLCSRTGSTMFVAVELLAHF